MKEQTREEPTILAAAERQMQAWSLTQEISERMIRVDCGQPITRPLGHFISMSREAGADGGHIAALVGRELGWEVLDKCLLDRVAERYRLSRQMLEIVDETQSNWAYDLLGQWLDPKIIPHEKYFVLLSRVILATARRGNVVLVGRGATFLLPRDEGLAVRIVASEKYRIEKLMARHEVDAAQARAMMVELDRGRRDFAQKFFHRDIDDPHYYDLVVNADRLGPEGASRQIVTAYRNQ
jgi:cytidylate kinase